MDLNADFFALLGLPRRFRLAAGELDSRYRELQARVHPDRFASAPEAERRLSMQWASQANEAYRTLKKPLARAGYLIELAGVDLRAETNTAMPADFLMQQMEWREALEDANSVADVEAVEAEAQRARKDVLETCETLLDTTHDYPQAAQQVRALMFIERFMPDIDARLEQLGQ